MGGQSAALNWTFVVIWKKHFKNAKKFCKKIQKMFDFSLNKHKKWSQKGKNALKFLMRGKIVDYLKSKNKSPLMKNKSICAFFSLPKNRRQKWSNHSGQLLKQISIWKSVCYYFYTNMGFLNEYCTNHKISFWHYYIINSTLTTVAHRITRII